MPSKASPVMRRLQRQSAFRPMISAESGAIFQRRCFWQSKTPSTRTSLPSVRPLPFAVEGFTIVYGDNGSGKSGYGRLLRGLCRARRDRAERILGDVYAQTTRRPLK